MKSIQTSVLMSLLAAFAFGCTSTTALQTSETDDMYYASTDKTVRQQTGNPPAETTTTNSEEAANPEYSGSGTASSSGGTTVNNYNYYDSDYSYASRSRTVRSPYRNWSYYDYGYYNDPYWYAPGAFVTPYYSAVYCYPGMYDPFWGPAYYPYSGITVSIGYGFGYGGFYGGHRPWGYRPYYGGYYGGGYGNGYYQGFYEGYYAGNNSYYGVNRRKINYGPRGDRSNAPQSAPASATGRPNGNRQEVGGITPGRPVAPSGNNGTTTGRPNRVATNNNQPQPANQNQINSARPARTVGAEQNQIGQVTTPAITRPEQPAGRPTQTVKPQNYEFQARPTEQNNVQQSNVQQNSPRNVVQQQNNAPAMQQDQPVRSNREQTTQPERQVYQTQPGLSRPGRQQVNQQPRPENVNPPVMEQAPQQQGSRGIFNRPSRSEQQAPVIRENRGYSQPSQSGSSPSRNSNPAPSNSGGRPRR